MDESAEAVRLRQGLMDAIRYQARLTDYIRRLPDYRDHVETRTLDALVWDNPRLPRPASTADSPSGVAASQVRLPDGPRTASVPIPPSEVAASPVWLHADSRPASLAEMSRPATTAPGHFELRKTTGGLELQPHSSISPRAR